MGGSGAVGGGRNVFVQWREILHRLVAIDADVTVVLIAFSERIIARTFGYHPPPARASRAVVERRHRDCETDDIEAF